MKTLLLTNKDIKKFLTPKIAIKAVQKAFRAHGLNQMEMPAKSYLNFTKGDLRTMPAFLHGQGFKMAGTKMVNVHPQNPRQGLPTVMAVMTLTDPENGFPLAVMDGTHITNMRTGAAGALAARLLSKKQSKIAGFVGCGVQAHTQLACLMEVRKIKHIKVWQYPADDDMPFQFCRWAEKTFHVEAAASPDINDITTGVDILITTTASRAPLVYKVSSGTHINAIGADAQGKQEIHPAILKKALVVIDDWSQAPHSGEINVPLNKRQITRKQIHGTLGEIATGKIQGRTSDTQITLFDSTGLAIQDVACAATVYQALKDKKSIKKIALF